jgi:hypothetical protein
MLPKIAHLWALVCFLLVLQLATAHNVNLLARQDGGGDSEVTATGSEPGNEPEPTRTDAESTIAETDAPRTTGTEKNGGTTTTFTSDEPRSTSIISTTATDNSTFYDSMLTKTGLA